MISTEDVVTLGLALGYPTGWLVAARALYGKWRYEEIEAGGTFPRCALDHLYDDGYYRRSCCAKEAANKKLAPHWWISLLACAAALAWPAVLLLLGVIAKPREHPKEIEERERQRKARIAELERDLEESRKALERAKEND